MRGFMEALHPLTTELLDALQAHVAVLDEAGVVIAVNEAWRRFGLANGAGSDFVGQSYLDVCAKASRAEDRAGSRVHRRLSALINGEADGFTLAYFCAARVFRLRAARVASGPARFMLSHEDITALVVLRRRLHGAATGLTEARGEHAAQLNRVYEELGQRLAAIGLAVHTLERSAAAAGAVDTIRIAVREAKHELRLLRDPSYSGADKELI